MLFQASDVVMMKGRNQSKGSLQPLQEALKPLIEEQKSINEKIAKLNHSIEVCICIHVVKLNHSIEVCI